MLTKRNFLRSKGILLIGFVVFGLMLSTSLPSISMASKMDSNVGIQFTGDGDLPIGVDSSEEPYPIIPGGTGNGRLPQTGVTPTNYNAILAGLFALGMGIMLFKVKKEEGGEFNGF